MNFEKVKLNYSYDALEPYIDAETIDIHYNKHLQGYVDKLNMILEGYEKFVDKKTLKHILSNPCKIPKLIRQDVISQGGGVFNHNLYFESLSPKGKKAPTGKLLDEIKKTFSSLDYMIDKISSIAINTFGSGYGWLVCDKKGRLKIISTKNQDTPLSLNLYPLLNIDLWEHAYYLKYKNKRSDYVKNIWNIIDWSIVEERYNKI